MLNEDSTIEEIENFLLYYIDEADGRMSTINPSLTKEQVWNVSMGAVARGDITKTHSILIKNITREFGIYYKGQQKLVSIKEGERK